MILPESVQRKRWRLAPELPQALRQSLPQLNPILLQVLYNRGIVDQAHIQSFLEGRYLEAVDPFLLAGMETAVARLKRAIERDETIVVYGDFDADGVTATVLLTEALRGLGVSRRNAQPYIPDRVDEGYGLNIEALDTLKARGADVVISVDCGIRSVMEAAHAKAIGLDLIVTDHHNLGREMPPALAVVNPKRDDSAYPERSLAGVGIAYKVAQALYQALPERVAYDLSNVLDLVAIGTVADLAPLQGENRRLVIEGLSVLNEMRRPGVRALVDSARLNGGKLTAESIAFFLGPRINAAGRLAHAYSAAKLLAAPSLNRARDLARELEQLNRKRQQLTESLSQMAESLIDPEAPLLMAASDAFEPGVVGLVASRLADRHYRPAIVVERGPQESRGSCRSIPEFHITDALDEVSDLLVRHGGHAQAAGFTVRTPDLATLEGALREIAAQQLADKSLIPTLAIDAELPLHEISWALHDQFQKLEPTGQANETPVFMSRRVQVVHSRVVGRDQSHMQLELAAGGSGLRGIAFRQAAWHGRMPPLIDIAFTLSVNEWNGSRTLQLNVKDIQAHDGNAPTAARAT